MAWNEPGGSGNKDPWGGGNRGGNNQGPPDLDEVVKQLQQKFGAIFGGAKKGGGGSTAGGGGKAGSIGLGVIAVVLLVVWAISGIYIVDEGRRGVVLQFGAYAKTTMPGPHWLPRFIQSVEVVNVEESRALTVGFRQTGGSRPTSSTVGRESLMLTQDENIVDVKLAVQYKVKSASDYLFRVRDPEIVLRQVTESAIREVIGKSDMDFILKEGRADITAQAMTQIQNILDRYGSGLIITTVNLQDAQPPEQVQDAFADAVKAQGDSERVKNEAEAYSNDIIPRARGKAARQIAEANAYKEQVIAEAVGEASRFKQVLAEYVKAPEVTRKRLYIESMESVLSNSSKVLVDVKEGNNIMYLPLDQMMGGGSGSGSSSSRRIVESIGATQSSSQDRRVRDNLRSRGER
ncbi:MAG TPA: FtsH protease activity modulator HflK [Gammaproteobacteria bacterium]|nr:FtsH protease activity modulator HflK [Gammaproteobacteria bacterium]